MPIIPWHCLVVLLVGVIPAALRAWDIGQMVAETIDDLRIPRKVAADQLGLSAPQLSRALAGTGPEHLSADRLTRLDRPFWLLLTIRINEHFNVIPPASTRAERLARVTMRAAKASLRRDLQGGERASTVA